MVDGRSPPKLPKIRPPRHNSITDFLPRVVFIVSITSGLQGPSAQLSPAIPGLGGPNAIVNRLEAQANHDHPGDASCKKNPPDASPDLAPQPQAVETLELKTPCITTPHTGQRCVTRVRCLTGLEKPVPLRPTRYRFSEIAYNNRGDYDP